MAKNNITPVDPPTEPDNAEAPILFFRLKDPYVNRFLDFHEADPDWPLEDRIRDFRNLNRVHPSITCVSITPNPKFAQFRRKHGRHVIENVYYWDYLSGLDGNMRFSYVGTKDELLEASVAEDYMFKTGKSGVKSGCDEYGTKYRVTRFVKGRFRIEKWLQPEPEIPFGCSGALEKVDVGPLINTFVGGAS